MNKWMEVVMDRTSYMGARATAFEIYGWYTAQPLSKRFDRNFALVQRWMERTMRDAAARYKAQQRQALN